MNSSKCADAQKNWGKKGKKLMFLLAPQFFQKYHWLNCNASNRIFLIKKKQKSLFALSGSREYSETKKGSIVQKTKQKKLVGKKKTNIVSFQWSNWNKKKFFLLTLNLFNPNSFFCFHSCRMKAVAPKVLSLFPKQDNFLTKERILKAQLFCSLISQPKKRCEGDFLVSSNVLLLFFKNKLFQQKKEKRERGRERERENFFI